MRAILATIISSFLFTNAVFAATEFEAFYETTFRGKPIGIAFQRNEVNPTTGERTITYSVRVTSAGNDFDQFLRTKQDKGYHPLGYDSMSSVSKIQSKVDSRIRDNVMTVTTTGKSDTIERRELVLAPNTFLSSFLGPLLVRQKPVKGQAYSCSFIYEEESRVVEAEILILDAIEVGKHRIYRTMVRYPSFEMEILLLGDGTTIATQSTTLPVTTMIITDPKKLLAELDLSAEVVTKYFGQMPAGRLNAIAAGEFKIPEGGLFRQKPNLDQFKNVKRIPLRL